MALASGLFLATCDVTGPGKNGGPQPPLDPGELRLVVEASDPGAGPGERVSLAVKILRGQGAPTPTGFVAVMQWDSTRMEAVSDAFTSSSDGALLAVNPRAGPGHGKAAGASLDGLSGDTLFTLDARVLQDGWADQLAVELSELETLDGGAQMARNVTAGGLIR